MGAGTVNDPSNSYHLEFVCASKTLANDLRRMINSFVDLSAKVVQRKDSYIVYMKNSQYISDTLAIMGASSQVFAFEDVKIKKGLVNDAVRITNCDNANTDRALDAAQRQLAAIRKIEMEKGIDWLPEKLAHVARLRLAHPEATLIQLAEMMDPPMKKSGINNRFRKIEELAEKL